MNPRVATLGVRSDRHSRTRDRTRCDADRTIRTPYEIQFLSPLIMLGSIS